MGHITEGGGGGFFNKCYSERLGPRSNSLPFCISFGWIEKVLLSQTYNLSLFLTLEMRQETMIKTTSSPFIA